MENTGQTKLDWGRFRSLMPVTYRWAYLDHAAVAPLPSPTRETIARWADEATNEGDTLWQQWAARVEQVRARAAALVGAANEEIAFVPNTTAGISLVAEGFPWRPGDNVVTAANEFPSNQYPWLNLAARGVTTRRVPAPDGRLDLNRLAEACDERTRVVALSWVGYASGYRLDVAEAARVAHQRGAMFFLDAIQGLGVFPLDVRRDGVDFLAADGHKWLLGPEGAGLFYVRRELLDELRPIGVGWNSVVGRRDYTRIELQLRPEAARYEGGSPNMVGTLALGASLELLAEFGAGPVRSAVGERVLEVTDHACRRIEESGGRVASVREGAARSGIVSFELPGEDSGALCRKCVASGVALGHREGRIRISPHAYNNEEDIERLIAALRS